MAEKLELGAGPSSEPCAQSTWHDFAEVNRVEVRTWEEQLIRELGHPPEGCSFTIVSNAHDFGTYRELALRVDKPSDSCWNYFSLCEESSPEWDDQAVKDLVTRLRVVEVLKIELKGDVNYRDMLSRYYAAKNRR